MPSKIAVVQYQILNYRPVENLCRMEEWIKRASEDGCQIVVFPEDSITGSNEGINGFVDDARAYREHFEHLAKRYKIDIVPGTLIEKVGKSHFNTAFYIDSKGKTLSSHRKIHLWGEEKTYLKAGKTVDVFQTPYGKIGLLICWDAMFPERFREMADQGVQIVICPSDWCVEDCGIGCKLNSDSETQLVDALSTLRAFEQEIIFVFCNSAGAYKTEKQSGKSVGYSQVTAPFYGSLKKLPHNKEEMIIVDLDLSVLKTAETHYAIRSDHFR